MMMIRGHNRVSGNAALFFYGRRRRRRRCTYIMNVRPPKAQSLLARFQLQIPINMPQVVEQSVSRSSVNRCATQQPMTYLIEL
jgi:hypothetical protein